MGNYKQDMANYIINIDSTYHNFEEKEGLKEVYKKIENNDISDYKDLTGHLMILQFTLLSKCPIVFSEYRNSNTFITGSDVATSEYNLIARHINILNDEYLKLLDFSKSIQTKDQLNDYIKGCIRLNCKLIHIHPFTDGNGRLGRAILDYLFRQVEISPIIIDDRESYIEAMHDALTLENYDLIDSFYFGRIFGGKQCQKTR